MEKKKIMMIAEKYDGGVKTHLDVITNNLEEYEVVKLILRGDLNSPLNIKEEDSIFLKNFNLKNPIRFFKNIRMIKKILLNQNIDLIHLHSTVAGIFGLVLALALSKNKKRFIFTPHAYYSQKPSLNFFKKVVVIQIEKLICLFSSKVIHVSNGEEKHALENNIVEKNKSVIIYNGIKKRTKIQLEDNRLEGVVLGYLARVCYQKNPLRFVEIAVYVANNSSIPVKFVFGGDGPLLQDMKNLVMNKGIQEKVQFIGQVDNIEDFFSNINGYFSTSYYEGLPYSVIEAASFGLPLFLSDIIGHSELIKGNGILFDLNLSNKEIGDLIISILEKRTLFEEISKESLNVFEQDFEEKKMIEKLNTLYRNELIYSHKIS